MPLPTHSLFHSHFLKRLSPPGPYSVRTPSPPISFALFEMPFPIYFLSRSHFLECLSPPISNSVRTFLNPIFTNSIFRSHFLKCFSPPISYPVRTFLDSIFINSLFRSHFSNSSPCHSFSSMFHLFPYPQRLRPHSIFQRDATLWLDVKGK